MPWIPVTPTSQSWTTIAATSQQWRSSSLTLDPSSVVSRPVRVYPLDTGDNERFQWEVRDEDPFFLADANLSVVIPDSAVTVRP